MTRILKSLCVAVMSVVFKSRDLSICANIYRNIRVFRDERVEGHMNENEMREHPSMYLKICFFWH